MVSHLTVEEGSEKIYDLPKVVWLEVSKVGFELGSLAHEATPFCLPCICLQCIIRLHGCPGVFVD